METALMIAALIACILISFLVFVAIGAISQFKKLAESAEKNIDSIAGDVKAMKTRLMQSLDEMSALKAKTMTVLDDISDLKTDLSKSLTHIDSLAGTIEESAQDIGKKTDILFKMLEPVELLTKVVYSKIAGPVANGISIVSAAGKAVSAFSGKLFKKQ